MSKRRRKTKRWSMKQEMATTEWTEGLIPEATDLDLPKEPCDLSAEAVAGEVWICPGLLGAEVQGACRSHAFL